MGRELRTRQLKKHNRESGQKLVSTPAAAGNAPKVIRFALGDQTNTPRKDPPKNMKQTKSTLKCQTPTESKENVGGKLKTPKRTRSALNKNVAMSESKENDNGKPKTPKQIKKSPKTILMNHNALTDSKENDRDKQMTVDVGLNEISDAKPKTPKQARRVLKKHDALTDSRGNDGDKQMTVDVESKENDCGKEVTASVELNEISDAKPKTPKQARRVLKKRNALTDSKENDGDKQMTVDVGLNEISDAKAKTPKQARRVLKKHDVLTDSRGNDRVEPMPVDVESKENDCGKHMPVYVKEVTSPLKRKSLPIEDKLHLYDFEVDENEPKNKRKRKPILKMQKLRVYRRKKAVNIEPEPEKRVLRSVHQNCLAEEPRLDGDVHEIGHEPGITEVSPSKGPEPVKNKILVTVDVHPPPVSDQPMKEHRHVTTTSDPSYSLQERARVAPSSTPHDKISVVQPNRSKSPERPVSKQDSIPILFQSMNDSVGTDHTVGEVTHFSDDVHHMNDISSSTPIKFRHDVSSFNASKTSRDFSLDNCFGFDEAEVMEEPLVSPIKSSVPVLPVRTPDLKIVRTPAKSKKEETVPVSQVIKLLRFEVGTEETSQKILESDTTTSVSPSPEPSFDALETTEVVDKIVNKKQAPTAKKTESTAEPAEKKPRRSYERPEFLRKKKKYVDYDMEEEDDDEENHESEHAHKKAKKKKHRGEPSKKEKDELEKWAQQFNSQCQEVEGFNLVVE